MVPGIQLRFLQQPGFPPASNRALLSPSAERVLCTSHQIRSFSTARVICALRKEATPKEARVCAKRLGDLLDHQQPDPVKHRIALKTGDAIADLALEIGTLGTADLILHRSSSFDPALALLADELDANQLALFASGRNPFEDCLERLVPLLAQAIAELDNHYADVLSDRWPSLCDALLSARGAEGLSRWLQRLREEGDRVAQRCTGFNPSPPVRSPAAARIHHLIDVLEMIDRIGVDLVRSADEVIADAR